MSRKWGYVDMNPFYASRRRREKIIKALVIVALIVIVILACYGYAKQKAEDDAVRDEQQQCVDNGGVVNEFNCSSTCDEYGNCKKRCSWQCVRQRVPAERD